MNKEFISEILNGMNRLYGYGIIEVEEESALASNWALVRNINAASKRVIIFIEKGNQSFESLIFSLKHKLNCESIELVKILLADELSLSEDLAANSYDDNIIVADCNSKKILSYGYSAEQVANEFANFLYYKQSNVKEKEFGKSGYLFTYGIIAINIVVYILTAVLSKSFIDADINVLIYLGAKYNPFIRDGEYYRFITSIFLHGGIIHLFFNMYSLYSIGPMIEKIYGKTKFLVIYFASGILSSVSSFIFSEGVSVGASGAIFGLLGAALVFAVKVQRNIGKDFLKNIASVIIVNLFIGFTIPNIDNYAHLGGLIGGILITLIIAAHKNERS